MDSAHNGGMNKRPAFTLLEIITVVVIIVIMLGLAVPAFNYITGSRSVDAGQNIVAAALGRARNEAIHLGRPVGLCIFRDPAQDRVALALVTQPEFQSYAPTIQYRDAQTVTFDQAESFVTDTTGNFYACATPTAAGTAPPNTGWLRVASDTLTLLPGGGFNYLQPGVGAEVLGQLGINPVSKFAPGSSDRYLSMGVILFDGQGKLVSKTYSIDYDPAKKAGTKLGLAALASQPRYGSAPREKFSGNAPVFFSGIGLVLYDRVAFRSQSFDDRDWATTSNQNYTASYSSPTAAAESAEEKWLDQNGLSMLVNRYTGSLIRAE
jgi:type II secretory pathway pseudopilin PulG